MWVSRVGGNLGGVLRRSFRCSHQVSIFFAIACCLAGWGHVPSGGWGEIVVLYDGWRFVAEGLFGLAGYSDLCVRYDLLHTVERWWFVEGSSLGITSGLGSTNAWSFLHSWEPVSFSRRSLLHAVRHKKWPARRPEDRMRTLQSRQPTACPAFSLTSPLPFLKAAGLRCVSVFCYSSKLDTEQLLVSTWTRPAWE